jgi:hypothetical protein
MIPVPEKLYPRDAAVMTYQFIKNLAPEYL